MCIHSVCVPTGSSVALSFTLNVLWNETWSKCETLVVWQQAVTCVGWRCPSSFFRDGLWKGCPELIPRFGAVDFAGSVSFELKPINTRPDILVLKLMLAKCTDFWRFLKFWRSLPWAKSSMWDIQAAACPFQPAPAIISPEKHQLWLLTPLFCTQPKIFYEGRYWNQLQQREPSVLLQVHILSISISASYFWTRTFSIWIKWLMTRC